MEEWNTKSDEEKVENARKHTHTCIHAQRKNRSGRLILTKRTPSLPTCRASVSPEEDRTC